MSVITSNWMPSQADAPAGPPINARPDLRREVEFRSALDGYLAGYREHLSMRQSGHRPHRALFAIFPRLVAALRHRSGDAVRID